MATLRTPEASHPVAIPCIWCGDGWGERCLFSSSFRSSLCRVLHRVTLHILVLLSLSQRYSAVSSHLVLFILALGAEEEMVCHHCSDPASVSYMLRVLGLWPFPSSTPPPAVVVDSAGNLLLLKEENCVISLVHSLPSLQWVCTYVLSAAILVVLPLQVKGFLLWWREGRSIQVELLARPVWLLVPLPQICATFSRHLVLVSLSSWWVHGIEPDENVAPEDAHNPSRPHVALTSLSAVELTSVGHCPVASPPDDATLSSLFTDTVSA